MEERLLPDGKDRKTEPVDDVNPASESSDDRQEVL